MFRDCYFEYAGVYSGKYNLVLEYLNNSYTDFNSGGICEPVTDTIPCSPRQLLYNLNYADNPLSFDIEIFNIDGAIPFEQMEEIKNWLFGQNGFKKFKLFNGKSNYYLSAILIPNEDIVDCLGYRGLRCTLQNSSGFWYQDFSIDLKENRSLESMQKVECDVKINYTSPYNYCKILPILKIENGNGFNFKIQNITNDTELNLKYTYNGQCSVAYDCRYRNGFNLLTNEITTVIDYSEKNNFYLNYGLNKIIIDKSVLDTIQKCELQYTTYHRVGAF